MTRLAVVDFEEALRTFARRFHDGVEPEVIEGQFNYLWSTGRLEFGRDQDGKLKVLLGSARR